MKTISSRSIRISAALTLALLTAVAGAQFAQAAPLRHISVSSTGTIQVVPDAVRLNASVSVVATVSKEALATANIAADQFRSAIYSNGIDKKYLKSTSLTIYPEYNYTQESGNVLTGYRANQNFEVVIRDATKAGEIVDALVASAGDALYINGVTPFILDNTSAIDAARVAAVKSAKFKVKAYAKLLGVKIGKIIWLQESSPPISFPSSKVQAKSD